MVKSRRSLTRISVDSRKTETNLLSESISSSLTPVGVLEPLVVHNEALNHILTKISVCPLQELRAALAAYTETDSDYN